MSYCSYKINLIQKGGGGGEKVSENSAAEINQISVSVMFCIFLIVDVFAYFSHS